MHVTTGARSTHLQSLGDRHEGLAAQRAAHKVVQRSQQMRNVAEGFVLDEDAVEVAAPKQMALVDTAFAAAPCIDDIHAAPTFLHKLKRSTSQTNKHYLVTKQCSHVTFSISPHTQNK